MQFLRSAAAKNLLSQGKSRAGGSPGGGGAGGVGAAGAAADLWGFQGKGKGFMKSPDERVNSSITCEHGKLVSDR